MQQQPPSYHPQTGLPLELYPAAGAQAPVDSAGAQPAAPSPSQLHAVEASGASSAGGSRQEAAAQGVQGSSRTSTSASAMEGRSGGALSSARQCSSIPMAALPPGQPLPKHQQLDSCSDGFGVDGHGAETGAEAAAAGCGFMAVASTGVAGGRPAGASTASAPAESAERRVWMYPSEDMFYKAMQRKVRAFRGWHTARVGRWLLCSKGHALCVVCGIPAAIGIVRRQIQCVGNLLRVENGKSREDPPCLQGWQPDARDMPTVVAIHNAVNERAWQEVSETVCCGSPGHSSCWIVDGV
jgi:hypothetical protein